MPKKLELNKETLRHLSDQDLTEVAGGAATTGCDPITGTMRCPSGATWFAPCESHFTVPVCVG
jgi:hypothetical protein